MVSIDHSSLVLIAKHQVVHYIFVVHTTFFLDEYVIFRKGMARIFGIHRALKPDGIHELLDVNLFPP